MQWNRFLWYFLYAVLSTLDDLLLKSLRFRFMCIEFQQSFDILQLQISINHQSIELSKLILRSLDSLLQKIQLLLRIYFIFNFKCQISIFYSFHKPWGLSQSNEALKMYVCVCVGPMWVPIPQKDYLRISKTEIAYLYFKNFDFKIITL